MSIYVFGIRFTFNVSRFTFGASQTRLLSEPSGDRRRCLRGCASEAIRRLELEIEQRRERAQAVLLVGGNENQHARPDRLNAFRRLDLRLAIHDEVEVLADLVVMQWRRRALRVRHHTGEHVVDVGQLLVHKERSHAPAGRALEARQFVLMKDVGQSTLPCRSTGLQACLDLV